MKEQKRLVKQIVLDEDDHRRTIVAAKGYWLVDDTYAVDLKNELGKTVKLWNKRYIVEIVYA